MILSRNRLPGRVGMRITLGLTAFTAIGGAGFAIAVLRDPTAPFLGATPVDAGDKLYLNMYAVRALSLSVVAGGAVALRSRTALIPVIALLAVSQLADAALGLASGRTGNIVAPSAQGVGLIACTAYLIRQRVAEPTE